MEEALKWIGGLSGFGLMLFTIVFLARRTRNRHATRPDRIRK